MGLSPVIVELPQPVLGRGESISEEKAIVSLCKNVRHTPLVPCDFDLPRQARYGPGSLHRGNASSRLLRPPLVELGSCQSGVLADRLDRVPRPESEQHVFVRVVHVLSPLVEYFRISVKSSYAIPSHPSTSSERAGLYAKSFALGIVTPRLWGHAGLSVTGDASKRKHVRPEPVEG